MLLTSKSYWQMLSTALWMITYTLCLPLASESPPLGDTSGDSSTPGSWVWWSTAYQTGARYTETSPLERTSDSGAWWKGTLQNARERERKDKRFMYHSVIKTLLWCNTYNYSDKNWFCNKKLKKETIVLLLLTKIKGDICRIQKLLL